MFVEAKFFHKAGEGSGGGSDPHNLGYYADLTALQTAHPTGTDGDFAILGSTDTIWVWDSDTTAWKDTDTKGQVTSVNNQTGAVILTASDVGALPSNTHIPADPVQADWNEADSTALDYIKNKPTLGTAASANTTDFATAAQGAKADTAVQPGNLATVATTGAYSDLTGTPTIPAAQVNSDWNASSGVAEILNKPTLATVATSGAYSDLTGTPTIPAAIQVSTMPTAAAGELDKIYQFVGTTDANYTNGYFYKCVSDGAVTPTYSWTRTDVQPGSSLPSQSGNSGKFLKTDGTNLSWGKALENTATGAYALAAGPGNQATGVRATVVGSESIASQQEAVFVGNYIRETNGGSYGAIAIGANIQVGYQAGSAICIGEYAGIQDGASCGVAIGNNAKTAAAYAIQLGRGTNSEAYTLYFGNRINNVNYNYKIVNSDGTIPTDRFTTTPSSDGTYVPTLTISSGVATRTWGAAASAPVVPATMPTLAVADWSSNTQTVNVTGVTASNIVFVSPAPASAADYAAAGIVCTAQGSGTLTFTCTTVPSNAITVNVVILG